MKIPFAVIEVAYARHLKPTPFSARQIERYGLRSVAETALPDVGRLRTVLCDDEIDRLVEGLSPDEPVEIVD